jgi:DNA-binding transcriptional LysR family regulator
MKTYDLNLLRVLDAVLTAGSVTAAAERLHLSVPATSHALTRLRDVMADPLLVRAGRRLVPTPRAQALREPIARLLADAHGLVHRSDASALGSIERRFVVRAPDGIAITYGGALAELLQRAMPRAQLQFLPEMHDEAGALREGRVDIDVGNFEPSDPEAQVVELLVQRQVALVRSGHRLAARPVTARRYVAHAHVAVQTRHRTAAAVDRALAALGLARRVVVTVAHANVAPIVAARSELVATIGEHTANAIAATFRLKVLPLPFVSEPEPLRMVWHPRHAGDPAHAWLREAMLKVIVGEPAATRLLARTQAARERHARKKV